MSEFGGLEEKAESLAQDHPEQAKKGMEEAAQFAERETGNKYDSQIEGAAGAAEEHLGVPIPARAAKTSSRGLGPDRADPGRSCRCRRRQ